MGLLFFSWGLIAGRGKEVKRLKIRGHRGGGNKHFCNSLKINFFSVCSVVGF